MPGIILIEDTTIDGNSTFNEGSERGGGAVYSSAQLTIRRSTVSHNTTLAGISGFGGGGAIFNDRGMLTLENVTISGNSALRGKGGGIYNTGQSNIQFTTITENTSPNAPGIFNEAGSTYRLSPLKPRLAPLDPPRLNCSRR